MGPDPGAAQGRIGKSTGHRVVIVGGGFGGLSCARALEGQPAQVLLLDRHNYHLFTPLLYQVATSLLNPSDIAYPFRAVFRRSRNVRFRQAAVTGVDLKRRVVRTHDGGDVPYDTLVLATGSENDYFANEELAAHTLGMKTLSEAMRLRNHVLACLEIAARAASDEERREWLTFVIAGGGPTGVEYAGALAELLRMVLGRDYPELRPEQARIVVVEGLDRLLGAFHQRLGAYAARALRDRGVEVRTSTLVEKATDEAVVVSRGEEIRTRTVVWSAGVRPADPLSHHEVRRSRRRRLEVDERLRLTGHADVFVIGDAASVSGNGGELPMLSPPAMQEGRYVARAIVRRLGADPDPKPFRYLDKGTMATIGRRAAVADVHGFKLAGTIGWLAWLLVHIYYLIGFRNRAVVLASWGWDYLRRDRPIRLILRSEADRVAASVEPEPREDSADG
ncbi:MAG: NAD(P)/FAD-dependent oxidoreductase [Actinobacteria bacterium]|nr:MAG: NAD(P)/FAD-dependent oxidoreductase [Actinomycetota bacterium]